MSEQVEKACTKCGNTKPLEEFSRSSGRRGDGRMVWCKACVRANNKVRREANLEAYRARDRASAKARAGQQRERDLEMRLRIFRHYCGGEPRCACCGETELAFLSIDHLNGGGNAHRKEVGRGRTFYRWVISRGFPPLFQILCHNCNQAKGYYGVCPHELARQAA